MTRTRFSLPTIDRPTNEPPPAEELLIASPADLDDLLERLEARGTVRCGLDTEADSLHSYREKLCLVQLCCADFLAVIDPLKIDASSLGKLVEFLHQREVWFHGADFDMTLLLRSYGFLPERILDTQIAARLLGHQRFGLASLIEDYFGVTLSKSSQKADWGSRPLKAKMLSYAYDDVRYLLPLADRLCEKLHEAGRWEWFEEWCRFARRAVLNRKERPAEEVWRISGWGRLERQGLAYLRELWYWRDRESEILDRPSFRVMSNQVLLDLAIAAAAGQEIRGAKGLRPAQCERLRMAIREAAALKKEDWPPKRVGVSKPREDLDQAAFDSLRKRRDEQAAKLGLDPAIVANRSALETLANDRSRSDEVLMRWQHDLLFGTRMEG
ncbi:MAG: ribonuclease D [Verrucomicrobia bacterium]|nr:ribonuclease D [Verrucomicrobiota bacterium]